MGRIRIKIRGEPLEAETLGFGFVGMGGGCGGDLDLIARLHVLGGIPIRSLTQTP